MTGSRKNLFTGRAGQLAVMAEFLIREMNVAIPEVDIGDDVIVVRNEDDVVTRVQVKTVNAKLLKRSQNSFAARFQIPLEQLIDGPQHLVYALVVRRDRPWDEFVLIRRSILERLHAGHRLGSVDAQRQRLMVTLRFEPDRIQSGVLNLQFFRKRFTPWPPPDEFPDEVVTG